MSNALVEQIAHLRPCKEAVKWIKSLPAETSLQTAWEQCENGSWMLWLIGKTIKSKPWSDDRKPFLACALDCADTVKHLRPKKLAKQIGGAVAVLRRWIKGKATKEAAIEAKEVLSIAADRAYAAYAAYAYADAADAAASFASLADAKAGSQKQTAAIVRQHYPRCPQV